MQAIRKFYDQTFREEDTESFISSHAPEWARYATADRIRMATNEAARQARRRGAVTVLDLGCGDGVAIRRLRRLVPEATIVGADISVVALRKAVAAGVRSPLVICDATHLPFRDSAFDIVLCTEVLEHVLEPGEMLDELGRACGGSLVLSTPCFGPWGSERYEGWAERWNSHVRRVMGARGVAAMLDQTPVLAGTSLHTGHVNAFTPARLAGLVRRGFRNVGVRGVYFNLPFLMLALQKRPQLAKYHRALQEMLFQRVPLFCTFIGKGDAVGNFEALVVASKKA